jgi:gliding motility-associated-like protein
VAVINVDSPIKVTSPLTDTDFILWEDHFAVYFDEDVSVVSDVYTAIRVEAHAEVVTAARDNPNEKNSPTSSSTSGSAPLDVNFIAYVSDAVQHYSWEFSSREDFSVLLATYPESELHYIFDRTGKYYVRLNVSDYANNCSEIALESPFIIEVSESFIEAPNYFTPNSSTDINDQFKVSYQSINKFKCTIFNRWGNFIYEYYDPAGGWDGKKDGKLVPPGVYFYVIEADGSDGIKHKLKGDINLLYKK